MREIRARAGDVEDINKGIKISKKDWENLHVHIASFNNFPTAAGLASSAAGLACLGNCFLYIFHLSNSVDVYYIFCFAEVILFGYWVFSVRIYFLVYQCVTFPTSQLIVLSIQGRTHI